MIMEGQTPPSLIVTLALIIVRLNVKVIARAANAALVKTAKHVLKAKTAEYVKYVNTRVKYVKSIVN